MSPEDRDEETETPEDVPKGLRTELLSGEETSQIDRIFVKFKPYIDYRLDSLIRPSPSNEQDFGPDPESKVFKRETESNKLKFKGNRKQFLFNTKIEDHNAFTLELLKKKDYEGAKKGIKNVINLIQSRQKLIKLADKSEGGWLVVEEYEHEELAEDSDDEKRKKKALIIRQVNFLGLSANMNLTKTGNFFEVSCNVFPLLGFLCLLQSLFSTNKLPKL